MKAEELRIGNYFQWKSVASMGRGIDRITNGQQIMDYLDFKEGIPLTEEWLLKFGFEYERSTVGGFERWEIRTTRGRIKILDKKFSWDVGAYSDYILYVHQLQNLYFSLTGKELVASI